MMTYQELIERGQDGDPIIDPAHPAEITDEGLFIPGDVEEGNTLDFLVKIEERGFRAWVRDTADAPEEFVGDEWSHEALMESYENLVDWIYAW